MTCNISPSVIAEAIALEQQIIHFHERLIRKAQERLKLLTEGEVTHFAQKPDPPMSEAKSTHTA